MREDQDRGSKRRERGFTLIEVMVSIAILCFGILAVATMQGSAIRSNHRGYRLTESTNLAQDRIEHLLTQPYTDLADLAGDGPQSDPWIAYATANGIDYLMPEGYTLTYEVTDEEPGGTALPFDGVLVTITVQSQEGRTTELEYLRPAIY